MIRIDCSVCQITYWGHENKYATDCPLCKAIYALQKIKEEIPAKSKLSIIHKINDIIKEYDGWRLK